MKTIYVIIGYTGEYSDQCSWLVKAYRNENAAKEHVLQATRKAKEWEVLRQGTYDSYSNWPKDWNAWDKVADCMDYTGTDYRYEKVNLVE